MINSKLVNIITLTCWDFKIYIAYPILTTVWMLFLFQTFDFFAHVPTIFCSCSSKTHGHFEFNRSSLRCAIAGPVKKCGIFKSERVHCVASFQWMSCWSKLRYLQKLPKFENDHNYKALPLHSHRNWQLFDDKLRIFDWEITVVVNEDASFSGTVLT